MRTRILHLTLAAASIFGGTLGAAVATATPAAACDTTVQSCPDPQGTCGVDMTCPPEDPTHGCGHDQTCQISDLASCDVAANILGDLVCH